MGIKNFLQNFNVIKYNNSRTYDDLYLDCNYLMYNLINKCNNNQEFEKKISNFINTLLKNVIITNNIYLIFDGLYDNTELVNPKTFKTRNYPISDDYDKQSIKPKLEIVKFFKETITLYINKKKERNILCFNIITDDDYTQGEGDLKLLNHIYKNKSENNCIISKDSDIILIACSLCSTLNINIDIINQPNTISYILYQDEFTKYGKDYVLLMLFLGNDYLPKLSNIDYETLLIGYNNYRRIYKKNIIEKFIDYNNLILFFECIIVYLKNNKNKKLSFSLKNLTIERFKIYYNNINWCLKLYKLIDNKNVYLMDTIGDKVINIYNFLYIKPF
jgi:hypothetical protein